MLLIARGLGFQAGKEVDFGKKENCRSEMKTANATASPSYRSFHSFSHLVEFPTSQLYLREFSLEAPT